MPKAKGLRTRSNQMTDPKNTQPGPTKQPELKKSEPQKVAQPAQQPQSAPVVLTEAQKSERQKAIDEAVKKAQETAAQKPAGPNVTEVAAKALEEVQAKRAAEALAPQTNGGEAPATGKRDRWPERLKRSTIANPVNFVHELADAMVKRDPTVRRKDVIEAAINAGVAGYTARTQYQDWYKNRRESQRA